MKTVLCFLLVVCFLDGVAQKNYQPGFVVKGNNDTTRGFINYRAWDRNPETLEFKASENSDPQQYSSHEIKAFSVVGEHYESAIVDVDVTPHKIDALERNPTPRYTRDTVFLQVIVRGVKSLFHLKDNETKSHFYILENASYLPLVYKQYYVAIGSSNKAVAENAAYKQTLSMYLKDCPEITVKINMIKKFDVRSVKKVFDFYYECVHLTSSHQEERAEGKFEFGVIGGVTLTTLKFSGDLKYFSDVDYESSINPSIGVFFDIRIVRSNGWKISNDIMYTSFNIKGRGPGGGGIVSSADHIFKCQYLKTHHMLQIGITKNPVFYIAGGLSLGLKLKEDIQTRVILISGSPSDRTFNSQEVEYGFLGGLGARLNKWNAELRYESSSGLSHSSSANDKLRRYHLFIKYRL